jgi:arylsulfatase A-like enzyme
MMFCRTTRRDFLKLVGLGAAAMAHPAALSSCKREKPLNILVLFTDDQRFDTIRALGNPGIHTPHLDTLVSGGTSFTNAFITGGTSGAVCMPSRAMLLTGRGLFHIEDTGSTIPENHVMMPELFRKHGYRTFGIGKWHNGREAFARCFMGGAEIMFGGMSDHWNVPVYDYDPNGAYAMRTPVIERPLHSNKITYKGYDHITEGKHSSELFADAAIAFLEKYKSPEPFFLYVSFTAPHDPRTAPKEFLDMYDPEKISPPPNFLPRHPFDNGEMNVRDELLSEFPRTPGEIQRHIAEYYAMISHLDAQIGRILECLQRSGQANNTLTVFTCDNGLALGQHGLLGKQSVYEHSVHVPLIFRGPGIPDGVHRDDLCYLTDIFRTVCDLTGMQKPDSVEGESLDPAIKNQTRKGREALYFSYRHFQRALRLRRWKLILYNVSGTKHTQLFDLDNDPWEMNNLAEDSSQADRIREMTEMLKSMMADADDPVRLDEPDWGVSQ